MPELIYIPSISKRKFILQKFTKIDISIYEGCIFDGYLVNFKSMFS